MFSATVLLSKHKYLHRSLPVLFLNPVNPMINPMKGESKVNDI